MDCGSGYNNITATWTQSFEWLFFLKYHAPLLRFFFIFPQSNHWVRDIKEEREQKKKSRLSMNNFCFFLPFKASSSWEHVCMFFFLVLLPHALCTHTHIHTSQIFSRICLPNFRNGMQMWFFYESIPYNKFKYSKYPFFCIFFFLPLIFMCPWNLWIFRFSI